MVNVRVMLENENRSSIVVSLPSSTPISSTRDPVRFEPQPFKYTGIGFLFKRVKNISRFSLMPKVPKSKTFWVGDPGKNWKRKKIYGELFRFTKHEFAAYYITFS